LIQYNTSFRCRRIEDTLAYARDYAQQLGIVRVTETTWLDRLGLPVFASIRPMAMTGSLCVNSGKGLTQKEAKVGAYMEAIEFAMAEPNRAGFKINSCLLESIYKGKDNLASILDLCPNIGIEIDSTIPIQCVETIEMNTGTIYNIPVDLVFHPSPLQPNFQQVFKSSTNGLSSGNSRTEALIHGLLEVIERHVLSFHFIQDETLIVEQKDLPDNVEKIRKKLLQEQIELVIRYAPNELNIPVFAAYVIDPDFQNPMFINVGYGCHINKSIALSRAIAEAIQSRLVLIHGARDDIPQSHEPFQGLSPREMQLNFQQMSYALKNAAEKTSFASLPSYNWTFSNLEEYYQQLLNLLRKKGFPEVLTVAYTPEDAPLHVMRTIVPKMEFYTHKCQRMGPLLKEYATKIAHQNFRGTDSE